MQNIPIDIIYHGMLLSGFAVPIRLERDYISLKIFIKGWSLGVLNKRNEKWSMDQPIDSAFVGSLGKYIDGYVHASEK